MSVLLPDSSMFYYKKKTDDASVNKKKTVDKKATSSKPFMLDVLVVKSREGKYHVGPIIRTA